MHLRACSLWGAVAGIYGAVIVVLCFLLVQRDGYTITASSLRGGLARCWGACCSRSRKGDTTLAGGAFLSKVPPRYGVAQLARNALFWLIVLGLKARSSARFDYTGGASCQVPVADSMQMSRAVCCDSARKRDAARGAQHTSARAHLALPPRVEKQHKNTTRMQFCLDFFLILKALPDPIRGLLKTNWLGTCGADRVIANTNIPCAENMVLVGAALSVLFLCFRLLCSTSSDLLSRANCPNSSSACARSLHAHAS
jgi:hypothetical protein